MAGIQKRETRQRRETRTKPRTWVAEWEKEENEAADHKCESLEFLVKSFTALTRRPNKSDIEEGMVARGLSMRGSSSLEDQALEMV